MEKMSEVVPGADARNLQQFLTHSKWDHREVMDQVAHDVCEELGTRKPCGLIIDESSFEKQGKHSVGVARQWLGRFGKVDNGQVGVFGVLASEKRVAAIDARLYLPEKWCDDADRCEEAGVPQEEQLFRTKIELALEIVEHARKQGVRFDWVGADAGYGKGLVFIDALHELGETFMVDIHSDFSVYEENPAPYLPRKSGRGRAPIRYKSKVQSKKAVDYVASLAPSSWNRIQVRNTTRGPMHLEVAVKSVFVWETNKESAHEYLLVASRSLDQQELKISLSNAEKSTPRKKLAFMQRQRFWVERTFEDGKSECGMSDYQCRKWAAWHHHMALVMMTMLFMLKERALQKDSRPLLSAADIEELLAKFLPRRDVSSEDIIRNLNERHRRRQNAIDSHTKSTRRKIRKIKRKPRSQKQSGK